MAQTHSSVLAVVALLVLAGCLAGFVGPVGGSMASEATAVDDVVASQVNETTEAGNESDDGAGIGAADDGEFPPGVTQSGVENASALIEAHRQALAESGYRFVLRTNLSTSFAGGVGQWAVQNGTVETDLSPFRFQTTSRLLFRNETVSPPPSVTDAWGNDTTVVVRTQRGNVSQVQRIDRTADGELRLDPSGPGPGPDDGQAPALETLLTQTTVIETVLQSGHFEVTDVRQEADRTRVTLNATEVNESAFDGDAENVSTFDASLVVDEAGRVVHIDYDLAFEEGQGPSVSYQYRVTDVGAVSVERPPWVSEAFEPVPTDNSTAVTG